MLGTTLRHYRLDAKIGEGGMGIVYKGWDTHLDRPVAIKVLPAQAVADPERRRRFVQEAKAASALNHPHIVTVYDVDSVDGVDFIAMEYIDGETLDRRIGGRPVRLNLVLKYAVQVADALVRAHGAGIVHRDLKPANLMVDRHEQIKVLDFGLAKLTEAPAAGESEATVTERQQTEKGTIVGTFAYMSPEQAEGKLVDARSDIFSFGCMLYEMVTGARPFQGTSRLGTLSAILSQSPPPLASKAPDVPHEMERIISRCLRKDPDRRFQQIAEVKLALEDLREEWESGSARQPAAIPAKRGIPLWLVGSAALLLAAAAGFLWWRGRTPIATGPAQLTRITSDSGLTQDPALSRDGKMLAYASDRATGENLDIWVQYLGSGNPVRLTTWDTDELEPDFSPDGSRIAFRSNRNGGGIYVIPVLGGEPVLVAPHGFRPRFSPDGNWIAYWTGSEGGTLGVSLRQTFVVGVNGGAPRQIAKDLEGASFPVWSPDGKRLIVTGWKAGAPRGAFEWWVVPFADGPAAATGAFPTFARQKILWDSAYPCVWTADSQWILFSAQSGDSTNLYRVRLSGGDYKIAHDAERITFGTSLETRPALGAGGQLALASGAFASHLWALPMDTNQGKITGEMTQITREASVDTIVRVSDDGRRIAYLSGPVSAQKVLLRDLGGASSKVLAPGWRISSWITLTGDGNRLIFNGAASPEERGIYSLDVNGGVPVRRSDNRNTIWGASSDGRYAFSQASGAYLRSITVIDCESGKESPFISHREWQVLSPQFSHDGRWVAIHVRNSEMTRQIYVMPFRPGQPTPLSEWVAITDGKRLDRDPKWSPDGNLLYFLADREGARGIYAQRLNPATKQPQGPAFEVKMFRGSRRSMMYITNSGQSAPAVARDKIVFALGEMTGNIWLTKLP